LENDGDAVSKLLTVSLAKIRSNTSITQCVTICRDIYELNTVSYHATGSSVVPQMMPYVRSTYSPAWVKHYIESGYLSIDPVINEGFDHSLPFDWDELHRDSPEQQAFFADSLGYGLGERGLSIPLTDKSGHRALFSITSSLDRPDWAVFKANYLKSFLDIAQVIHMQAMVAANRHASDIPKISAREAECLHWISLGKETPDIAIILGLSEHTIRSYLKSARFKLGCNTLAQAIFRCVQLGILRV